MGRSCTCVTPGNAASVASTASGSIPGGTASNDILTASVNKPHVFHKMIAAMTRLITGSIHAAPVAIMDSAPTTTPAETEASDRKSVGWGKSVEVSVDMGGRRILKKK